MFPTLHLQRLSITHCRIRDLPLDDAFVDVMREYRKLDDSVTMRMNRNGALFRQASRSSSRASSGPSLDSGVDNEACLYFWRQLVGTCYLNRL
jgi:Caffeine-induced death protein 2